jgi:hypothetical protein
MTFLRDLWVDLVDKKLWPFAVALVVALIAVPVLLTKSSASPLAPVPATAQTAAAAPGGPPAPDSAAALTQVSGSVSAGTVEGAVRDPFKQKHLPQVAATTSTTAATSVTPGGTSATPGGASTTSATSTTPSTHHVATVAKTTKVVIRFGPMNGSRPEITLDALEPLPNRANPIIVYLGQLKDGKTASFLVSADSQAPKGDGRCLPNRAICSTINLSPGDTEHFKFTRGKSTVQYQLDYKRFFTN